MATSVSATPRLPSVSVVIPTCHRRERLPAVVEPLLDDPATTEVVVVVDGCRDGSLELLQALAAKEPRLRPLFIENSGEMGARQAGVEHAVGEVVVLLDDDVVATPGLVTGHARRHGRGERRVIVGYMPTITPAERRPGGFATYLYAQEYERIRGTYESHPGAVLLDLWAGNISLRRADCLSVGLQSSFAARHHDREFGIRCLKAGLVGEFDRALLAHHVHHRPLHAFLRDARLQGRGRALIHQLHQDVVGPLAPDAFERHLPWPARWLVRASRSDRARRPMAAVLRHAARAAGPARLFGLESATAKLLRRIEEQRGALEVLRC